MKKLVSTSQPAAPELSQPAAAAELTAAHGEEIRKATARFCVNVPYEASQHGNYEVRAGDRFGDLEIDVPNGVYRVQGSDWVMTIAGKRLKKVVRAVPPDFGGPYVYVSAHAHR